MAYSAELEQRIDGLVGQWEPGKKKMFGGLAYFVNGNMCFSVRGEELLLRLGDAQADELLKIPGVHVAEMGKRVMKNWLQAGGQAIASDADLQELMSYGFDYALHQPPKE